jgi:hypothetical protein
VTLATCNAGLGTRANGEALCNLGDRARCADAEGALRRLGLVVPEGRGSF